MTYFVVILLPRECVRQVNMRIKAMHVCLDYQTGNKIVKCEESQNKHDVFLVMVIG